MKYHNIIAIFIFLFSFATTAVYSQNNGYKIQITVTDLDDSVAYLGYHFGEKKYLQDTSVVSKDGGLVFEGERELKTGLYFLYSKGYYMEFVVDETFFSISTSKSDPYQNMTVENSISNEYFRDFQLTMINHQLAISSLTTSLDSTSTKEDSVAMFDQMRALNKVNQTRRDSLKTLMADNYVGQILIMMSLNPELRFSGDSLTLEDKRRMYNEYRKGYFDELDFSSEGLLRSPIFHGKLMQYVDKVTFQNPDSVIVSIDELLEKSKNNDEMYRYILINMFKKYQNPKIMGMDKIFVHLSDEYYLKDKASWADEDMIKQLQDEMVYYRENQIGLQAPQIYLLDTLERPANLYAVKANYTILYFYSPTCGHCKKKTPVLLDVYHKLDGKAEVVAVDVDTEIDAWKKFIKDLGLDWINYADLNYKSNFRVQYNVRSTPVLYVLDKDKKIIGKRLDVDQVEQFINDQIRISEAGKSL